MVWREGMDRWAQLGTTPEFSAIPAAAMAHPSAIQQAPVQYQGPTASAKRRYGFAVSSLVCSLVGLLFCGAGADTPSRGFEGDVAANGVGIGVILGLLGVIFGGVAISRANQNPQVYGGKGMAVAGLVIGIVATVLGVFWLMRVFG